MTDIAYALDQLVPGAEYRGSTTANTREAYNALVWLDGRAKPSWDDILANGDAPAPRRIVPRRVIVDRLHAAGLLDAAKQALSSDSYKQERWYALETGPFADDADTIALLRAIGADPDAILAPE